MNPGKEILFFSFLRQIRQSDKKAYVLAIALVIIQISLTIVKLEATPFFLYGMYSEKIAATDTFAIEKIMINNVPLESYAPPVRKRLFLETDIDNYEEMKRNNYTDPLKTRIESKYPLIYRSFIYPAFAKRIYNTKESAQEFTQWFKQKCLAVAKKDSGNVQLVRTTFYLNRDNLSFNQIKYERLEDF